LSFVKRTEDPAQANFRYKGTLDDYKTCLHSTLFGNEKPIYEEFYNLDEDPHEEFNLIENPLYSEEITYFRERIIFHGKLLKVDTTNPDTYEYDNNL